MATATSDWGLPTWKFIFNAGSQLHGADGPFLWGPQSGKSHHTFFPLRGKANVVVLDVNNATIADILKDWYLGFVINLDPNTISNSGTPKPHWPQYSPAGASGFTSMDFNYTMIGTVPDFDASSRCDFFHGQSYVVRN